MGDERVEHHDLVAAGDQRVDDVASPMNPAPPVTRTLMRSAATAARHDQPREPRQVAGELLEHRVLVDGRDVGPVLDARRRSR